MTEDQMTEEPTIVVLEDDVPDYTYAVDWRYVLKEVVRVHMVTFQQAAEMLRASSMEHPVQGRLCKYWRE
jgi:hypothetical protein